MPAPVAYHGPRTGAVSQSEDQAADRIDASRLVVVSPNSVPGSSCPGTRDAVTESGFLGREEKRLLYQTTCFQCLLEHCTQEKLKEIIWIHPKVYDVRVAPTRTFSSPDPIRAHWILRHLESRGIQAITSNCEDEDAICCGMLSGMQGAIFIPAEKIPKISSSKITVYSPP